MLSKELTCQDPLLPEAQCSSRQLPLIFFLKEYNKGIGKDHLLNKNLIQTQVLYIQKTMTITVLNQRNGNVSYIHQNNKRQKIKFQLNKESIEALGTPWYIAFALKRR